MKKYIISVLFALLFLVGAPFAINQARAADMSMRDFINLLITIGVITPDKMPAVNAYLATLDNNSTSSPYISLVAHVNESLYYRVTGERLSGSQVYFNGQLVQSPYVSDSMINFFIPSPEINGAYPVYVQNSNGKSNTVYLDISDALQPATTTENASGIIKSVYTQSNRNYIDIDYVTLNSNFKPGCMSGAPYTNENTKIRTFEISPNAKYVIGGIDEDQITFQTFSNLFITTGFAYGAYQYSYQKYNPWDIVITNGVVTQINEHYLP